MDAVRIQSTTEKDPSDWVEAITGASKLARMVIRSDAIIAGLSQLIALDAVRLGQTGGERER